MSSIVPVLKRRQCHPLSSTSGPMIYNYCFPVSVDVTVIVNPAVVTCFGTSQFSLFAFRLCQYSDYGSGGV